jgi:hypothetical protein
MEKFILNKELYWLPQLMDGFKAPIEVEIPTFRELWAGLIGKKRVKIQGNMEVPGVDAKTWQQMLVLLEEVKQEENRKLDEMKRGR